MEEKEVVIRIRHLSKEYRLGVIGRGTLQRDLQSWWARKRGKPDPNQRIGRREYTSKECFYALEDVSFDVHRGERIGVIGANGAGKSTLFKLLARVTAPTEGAIGVKGRISSMLEVGTGFHGELTGRENIYLNGAILGMKRQEIDACIDQIIAFSECEEFIDTPVKRYSSGMYVKLAFAVAAHLNSELLLMDEVLAVGDMHFQKKCLDKMTQLSNDEQKTILYVSHNMETIRTLCNRCIVLEKGHLVFDGEPEEAIAKYLGDVVQMKLHYTYEADANDRRTTGKMQFTSLDIKNSNQVTAKEGIGFSVAFAKNTSAGVGIHFDTTSLTKGEYVAELAAVEPMGGGRQWRHAWLEHAFAFEITEDAFGQYSLNRNAKKWGYTVYPDLKIEKCDRM